MNTPGPTTERLRPEEIIPLPKPLQTPSPSLGEAQGSREPVLPQISQIVQSTPPQPAPNLPAKPAVTTAPSSTIPTPTTEPTEPTEPAEPIESIEESPTVNRLNAIIQSIRSSGTALLARFKNGQHDHRPFSFTNNDALLEDLGRIVSILADRKLSDEERAILEEKMEELINENEGMRDYIERVLVQHAGEPGTASREVLILKTKRRRELAIFAAILVVVIGISRVYGSKANAESIPSMSIPTENRANHSSLATTPQLDVNRSEGVTVEAPVMNPTVARFEIPSLAALESDIRARQSLSPEEEHEMNLLMEKVRGEALLNDQEVERVTRLVGRTIAALEERLEQLIRQAANDFEKDSLRSRKGMERDIVDRRNRLEQMSRERRLEVTAKTRSLRTIVETAITRSR